MDTLRRHSTGRCGTKLNQRFPCDTTSHAHLSRSQIWCSAISPLSGRALGVTPGCEAPETTKPPSSDGPPRREARWRLPAPRRSGARG